ncbi:MAG: exodeoxyribonuclease VII large subunit [Tissierellia bacterium]|nr:exodeoxyribonuclease VII large subunit [Tissierellia bacterium]
MTTKPLKVSEVNNYIKKIFAGDWLLSDIKVEGEISNFKHHYSGHMYFSLKDERGKLKCVMFKSDNRSVNFELEDGLKVVITGYISVYEREGDYQLYAKKIEKSGVGDLFQAFEELKNKLEKEGLFDISIKKEIPPMPKKIGVVTSSTGAAIRDIINVIKRRFPIADILIYPVLVQGVQAPKEISEGLIYLDNREDIDVIITGRGGGSIEELFAFNDELVARTIYNMNTPVVSAVGHETDFTIADFVADLRAPTPSAAAELITPELNKLKEDLYNKFIQLNRYYHYILESQNKNLEYIKKDLNYYNPVNQILDKYQILDNLFRNLIMLMETNIEKNKNKIENLYSKIDYLNPSSSLERGYTIVLDENGKLVPSLKELSVDDTLNLIFKDGMVNIKVVKINKGEFYDGRE